MDMNIQDIKKLRVKAHSLDPVLQIGKGGVTDSMVKEILKQLKKRKLIKIRLLKAAGDRKKLVDEIVSKTKATLVRSVGRVVVLFKR